MTFRRAVSPSVRVALGLALVLALGCAKAENPGPVRVANPQSVIALAPSAVEILYELGLGDRLVGVGDYCAFPPEAQAKPRLGGLFDPHLEEIARIGPEIAILLPSEERLRNHLEELGIEVLTVESESLDDIEAAAMTISRRFSVEDRGEAFVEAWREALAPRPLARSPRVLLAVSRQRGTLADTLSAGPETFYHELLELMGAVNVFGDATTLYPQVSLEEAMQRLPDAIFDLRADVPNSFVAGELEADWNPLAGVPALERGCYQIIAGDYVLLPGPRLTRLYDEIRTALVECGF